MPRKNKPNRQINVNEFINQKIIARQRELARLLNNATIKNQQDIMEYVFNLHSFSEIMKTKDKDWLLEKANFAYDKGIKNNVLMKNSGFFAYLIEIYSTIERYDLSLELYDKAIQNETTDDKCIFIGALGAAYHLGDFYKVLEIIKDADKYQSANEYFKTLAVKCCNNNICSIIEKCFNSELTDEKYNKLKDAYNGFVEVVISLKLPLQSCEIKSITDIIFIAESKKDYRFVRKIINDASKIGIDKNPFIIIETMECNIHEERHENVIKMYEKHFENLKYYGDFFLVAIKAANSQNDHEKAVNIYEKFIESCKDFIIPYNPYLVGESYYSLGRYEEALRAYENSPLFFSDNIIVENFEYGFCGLNEESYLRYIEIANKINDYERIEKICNHIIEKKPFSKDFNFIFAKASALAKNKKYEQSFEICERLIESSNSDDIKVDLLLLAIKSGFSSLQGDDNEKYLRILKIYNKTMELYKLGKIPYCRDLNQIFRWGNRVAECIGDAELINNVDTETKQVDIDIINNLATGKRIENTYAISVAISSTFIRAEYAKAIRIFKFIAKNDMVIKDEDFFNYAINSMLFVTKKEALVFREERAFTQLNNTIKKLLENYNSVIDFAIKCEVDLGNNKKIIENHDKVVSLCKYYGYSISENNKLPLKIVDKKQELDRLLEESNDKIIFEEPIKLPRWQLKDYATIEKSPESNTKYCDTEEHLQVSLEKILEDLKSREMIGSATSNFSEGQMTNIPDDKWQKFLLSIKNSMKQNNGQQLK